MVVKKGQQLWDGEDEGTGYGDWILRITSVVSLQPPITGPAPRPRVRNQKSQEKTLFRISCPRTCLAKVDSVFIQYSIYSVNREQQAGSSEQ